MLNANSNALGIIFPNSYDSTVPEMTNERLMASIPFGSRYRMIDFLLSSMVNSGIDNVTVVVRENYLSLLDHLGSGREWDLTRKNGGLNIVPPFAQRTSKVFSGRVEALNNILPFLKRQKEEYVVLSDANIVANFDFKAMIEAHIKSGADVTIAYNKEADNAATPDSVIAGREMFYTLKVDGDDVKEIKINQKPDGVNNVGMNIYVLKRELLIDMIAEAFVNGETYFERDILCKKLSELDVKAYEYTGYVARIYSVNKYFAESMKLLEVDNINKLFAPGPIYTKVRDDNPTRYIGDAKAKKVMVADGCVIEGTIENCILFRGVKIGKGAVVKNCILMQDTIIGDGAELSYVITDKDVTVNAGAELKGSESFPVYVAKGKTV